MSKLTVMLAAGVGYVLGAKAGNERYQQITAQANRLWKNPRVQDKAAQAQELVKENAPKVQDKLADAASAAASKAKKTVRGEGDDSSTASEPLAADPLIADRKVTRTHG
jgi:hypothetical protein